MSYHDTLLYMIEEAKMARELVFQETMGCLFSGDTSESLRCFQSGNNLDNYIMSIINML